MLYLLKRRKILWAAFSILFLVIILAAFTPWLAPFSPYETNPVNRLQAPSTDHWLGTDRYGRDVLSRVIYGARLSMLIGLSVSVIVLVIGTLSGIVSGYFSYADSIIMRIMDALMAVPSIMLALALMAIFGAGIRNVIIALAITFIPALSRIARGSTLAVREESFVESARASGAGNGRIIFRHLLPNILSPIIVHVTITFALTLVTEAALSFLGVGVPPEIPSWGSIIADGRDYMVRAPWLIIAPGVAIVLTVLSVNMIGDAIRDLVDPALRGVD